MEGWVKRVARTKRSKIEIIRKKRKNGEKEVVLHSCQTVVKKASQNKYSCIDKYYIHLLKAREDGQNHV